MTRIGAGLSAMTIAVAIIAGLLWQPWAGNAATTPEPAMPTQDKFGQDRAPVAGVKPTPFDADRAMKYLKELIAIGPRVSGTEGMKKQQTLVITHFEKLGAKVTKQEFQAKQYSRKDKVGMTNLVVSWFPDRPRRVILCTHYDTRPMAHEEQDRRSWSRPFDSANDGTSGVAMFMEMAHSMKDFPTTFGVDFVLFDGEEYIFEPSGPMGGGDKFFFGSEHFGDDYRATAATRKFKYEAAILFDLFAHTGATFRPEGHSLADAGALCKQMWDVAATVGSKSFVWERGPEVLDDHIALNRAGIPAIDIIDFDGYRPHWHKLSDTADKVSGPQMAEMAKVMTAWLQLIR